MRDWWKELNLTKNKIAINNQIDCSQWSTVTTQVIKDINILIKILRSYKSSDIWLVEIYFNYYVFYIRHINTDTGSFTQLKIEFMRALVLGNVELKYILQNFQSDGVQFQYCLKHKKSSLNLDYSKIEDI